jgi:phage terminase small subunit
LISLSGQRHDFKRTDMPRGGARPGAGRPRKNPETKAKAPAKKAAGRGYTLPNGEKSPDAPKDWPFGTKPPEQPAEPPPAPDVDSDDGLTDEQRAGLTPLEYLLAVMRSPNASKSARMTAAVQAAPYMHAKPAPVGKKEAKEQAAKKGGGRFTPKAPPRLVAAGGKKL